MGIFAGPLVLRNRNTKLLNGFRGRPVLFSDFGPGP